MTRAVRFSEDAELDLDDILAYVSAHDAPGKAAHILDSIAVTMETLTEFPERGSTPAELQALDEREVRQVYFKPYRMLYEILPNEVVILLVADGRRDMRTLLQRRLLQG